MAVHRDQFYLEIYYQIEIHYCINYAELDELYLINSIIKCIYDIQYTSQWATSSTFFTKESYKNKQKKRGYKPFLHFYVKS